jgi:aldehyde:ferredoxin oxidoreductase
MKSDLCGWTGSVLHIDLQRGESRTEHPGPDFYATYCGGRAMAGAYLRPHCTRQWDHPQMPVCIFTGPLTGTAAPASGRASLMTRSPLTGTVIDSPLGGRLATQLKQAGWDGIVITGTAETLVGIEIRDQRVSIVNAEPHQGAQTSEVFDSLHELMPPDASVACIGPAGEHRSPMASIMVDRYHPAGRGGLGASLGARNLKYLMVTGSGDVTVYDPEKLAEAGCEIMRLAAASPALMGPNGFARNGTAALLDLTDSRRMMPTDNFSKTHFPTAHALNAPAFNARYHARPHGCEGCPIHCHRMTDDARSIPDFVSLSHLTALIGNTDMELTMKAFDLLNRLGLDAVSAAGTLACVREITGRDFDENTLLPALHEMASGKGPGAGSRRYAAEHGEPERSMTSKGLELPAFDPRGAYGTALAVAVSTVGGCDQHAYPASHEILRKPVATDRFTFSGKARIIKTSEDVLAAADSLTACRFIFLAAGLEEYAKAVSAVTGMDMDLKTLQIIGERACFNERTMNALNGFDATHDDLPPRFFTEEGSSGDGIRISPLNREQFLQARAAYYHIRGLDEKGLPLKEKAQELGMEPMQDGDSA